MRCQAPAVVALCALAGWACARSAPPPTPAGPVAAPAAVSATPARARTPEECRTCRGDWGVHGLAPTPSCNCRTTDAGKRCTDGADCQGMCLAAPGPGGRDVVEVGPPARGFLVGACSEMVTVFGCNQIIERGARSRGPVNLDDPQPMLCVD